MSDEDLIVIPLPTLKGGVTFAVARLVRGRKAFHLPSVDRMQKSSIATVAYCANEYPISNEIQGLLL